MADTAEEIQTEYTRELFENTCFFARQGLIRAATSSFQVGSLYVEEFTQSNHPNAEHMKILRDSVEPYIREGLK